MRRLLGTLGFHASVVALACCPPVLVESGLFEAMDAARERAEDAGEDLICWFAGVYD